MNFRELKAIVARKNLTWQYDETPDLYSVYAVDGIIKHEADLYKDPTKLSGLSAQGLTDYQDDVTDFETNFKPNANWAAGIRSYPFSTPDFEFRGTGVSGTCAAGQTLDLDYQMPGKRYINGGLVLLDGSTIFDWMEFKAMDLGGIIPVPYRVAFPQYPTLKHWVEKWFVPQVPAGGASPLLHLATPYAGLVDPGIVLRGVYHSTGATEVKVAVNYMLHEPI